MTEALAQARSELEAGGFTCVIKHNGNTYTDTRRGVAPLLSLLESEVSYRGASAADKVVGAGAAYLYVIMGITELYAAVVSRPALRILESNAIKVYFGTEAPHIINRSGDGICPIEGAVSDAQNAQDALAKIKAKLKQLSEGK